MVVAAGLAAAFFTSVEQRAGAQASVQRTSGFETDLSGWYAWGALSRVAGGHTGQWAARVKNDTSADRSVSLNDTPNVTGLRAGDVVKVSAWVRTTTPSVSGALRIIEFPAGGGTAVAHQQAGVWLTGTAWRQVQLEYAVRRDGSNLDVNVLGWRLRPGQSFDADDVSVSTTATVAPAPTSSAPTPTMPPIGSLSPTAPAPTTSTKPAPTSSTPTSSPAPPPPSTSDCRVGAKLTPNCGALWGAYSLHGGPDPGSAVKNLEAKLGRKLDVSLRYHDFSTSFPGVWPDRHEQDLSNGGRILFASWQSQIYATQTPLRWADIAAGKYDSTIVRPTADRVKAFGKPMFISFDAEFELRMAKGGTTAEYVAAWRHIVDVFRSRGATNAVWVWVSTGHLGGTYPQTIKSAYPGDSYVDWVGYDPYNFYKCNGAPWETFEQSVAGTYSWLMANGFGDKPFFLSEYGTQFDSANPTRAQAWHRSIPDVLRKYPNIKGLSRFDSDGGCHVYIDSGTGMLSAFAEAGRQPWVNVGH